MNNKVPFIGHMCDILKGKNHLHGKEAPYQGTDFFSGSRKEMNILTTNQISELFISGIQEAIRLVTYIITETVRQHPILCIAVFIGLPLLSLITKKIQKHI